LFLNQLAGGGVVGVAGAAGAAAALPKILNITVPQVGHLPLMALRPFFMVSSTPSAMGFFALHLTQYPSDIKKFTALTSCERQSGRLSAKADAVNPNREFHGEIRQNIQIKKGL
jgi:hypothetical protein